MGTTTSFSPSAGASGDRRCRTHALPSWTVSTDDLRLCRSILSGTASRFRDLRGRYNLEPEGGSIAARQLAEQTAFAGDWANQPVQDALSTADIRLLAAADFLESIARLILDPPQPFGPAPVARAAMECSSRAWWLFDPQANAKERILRGMIDRFVSVGEVSRVGIEAIDEQVQEAKRLTEEGAAAQGWEVRWTRRGGLQSIAEVDTPSAMGLLREQMGDPGPTIYRWLSAVSHGTLYGLANVTEEVGKADKEGTSYIQPVARPGTIATWAGGAALSFFRGV
jgi:hypothetical protein